MTAYSTRMNRVLSAYTTMALERAHDRLRILLANGCSAEEFKAELDKAIGQVRNEVREWTVVAADDDKAFDHLVQHDRIDPADHSGRAADFLADRRKCSVNEIDLATSAPALWTAEWGREHHPDGWAPQSIAHAQRCLRRATEDGIAILPRTLRERLTAEGITEAGINAVELVGVASGALVPMVHPIVLAVAFFVPMHLPRDDWAEPPDTPICPYHHAPTGATPA